MVTLSINPVIKVLDFYPGHWKMSNRAGLDLSFNLISAVWRIDCWEATSMEAERLTVKTLQ